MHFDPVASHEASAFDTAAFPSEAEVEQEDGQPAERPREGLPSGFRMRHGRHYVDELLGDAPVRTVREISVADIEAPPDDTTDLKPLEVSIRKLGVLEPLLVGRHAERHGHFRVIAGIQRLRAARRVGLGTVPCLVHDVDDEMLKDMRHAATQRATPVASEPALQPGVPAPSEATQGVEFVSALLPAMNAAGNDRFRWSILADLAGVELLRARTAASCAEILSRTRPPERTRTRAADLFEGPVSAVAIEARLRGVRLDIVEADPDYLIWIDAELYRSAVTGLLHAMLALAPRKGAVLSVRMRGTTIRPALILDVALSEVEGDALTTEALARFFDREWQAHPAGPAGALMLSALTHVAHLHAGRVGAESRPPKGCGLTFVVPQPV